MPRCPIALLNDLAPDSRMEIDSVIRLAVAKRTGNLSPYPGNYSVRALALIDTAESEIMKIQDQRADEAHREAERKAKTASKVRTI